MSREINTIIKPELKEKKDEIRGETVFRPWFKICQIKLSTFICIAFHENNPSFPAENSLTKIIFISEPSTMSNVSKINVKTIASLQATDRICFLAEAIKLPYKGQLSVVFKLSDYY